MKALVFDAAGHPLREADVPDPTPGRDEVVIKVCRSGICGSDLHMTEDPGIFGSGAGDVIGHEFSGEVLEVGRDVTDLRPGDLVAAAPLRGCGDCTPCRNGNPAWCEKGMTLIGGGHALNTPLWPVVSCASCRRTSRWLTARWPSRWPSRCTAFYGRG